MQRNLEQVVICPEHPTLVTDQFAEDILVGQIVHGRQVVDSMRSLKDTLFVDFRQ